jgi:hypothetical protein
VLKVVVDILNIHFWDDRFAIVPHELRYELLY